MCCSLCFPNSFEKKIAPSDMLKGQSTWGQFASHLPEHPSVGIGTVLVISF
jgi:hypothetical protein